VPNRIPLCRYAVQHAGNNKTAEQITHDKLEESKILTENLVTADDSIALGLHLKGNDEVTLITRNKGQKPSVLASNEGTQTLLIIVSVLAMSSCSVRMFVSSHSILLSVEQLFMLEMFTVSSRHELYK
jgi:hypothetical protein